LEPKADLCHLYNAELYYFPLLRFIRKPVVYTVVSGLGRDDRIPSTDVLRRLKGIVVPSVEDRERLKQRGLDNVHMFRPGIDVSRFEQTPPATGPEFVLMAGSAPWTRKQFRTKGVNALLQVAQRMPSLRLVFLWRGWFTEEIRRRVNALGLADRVEIHTKRVDVNQVLSRAHAAVVLADKQKLVKAYPHSLLEALACGRPVLVSHRIAMADYVRKAGCGEVVQSLEPSDLLHAIQRLSENYEEHRINACRVGRTDFSQKDLVKSYQDLYESVVGSSR
jgi:glycosyltransferase involved in cell wall biosynthesis